MPYAAKQKVIIDTDPGIDDALALLMAIKNPHLDILAITTVAGNSTIENTTANAHYILKLAGRPDIPIYPGAAKPLARPLITASVHGKNGLAELPRPTIKNIENKASDQIINILNTHRDVKIIALGPLTNIAEAIKKSPKTMQTTTQTIIMGGAITVPGNQSPTAEFNFFVDPEAADVTMRLPILKTLLPLDICNNIELPLSAITSIHDQNLRHPLAHMLHFYIEQIARDTGKKAALMYDPLTIFYLLHPEKCHTQPYHLKIETSNKLLRGTSTAHNHKKANTIVVTHINQSDFIESFITALNTPYM